jgi:UDP-N-acetylglucosamine 2-epimerase (non-hydrolysing)
MKIAPFIRAIKDYNRNHSDTIQHILVHTGQHYDAFMSDAFFSELDIPVPDFNLGFGSGSHAEQLGNTMIAFEKVLISQNPDCIVLVGDVNATLSCSVIAKRHHFPVCHIEAGLRSGDTTMPEEINRIVTDRLSDLLLAPDAIAIDNLLKEGISRDKIKFVGNIMIDTLEANRAKASSMNIRSIVDSNALSSASPPESIPGDFEYALITMHRPSNVDNQEVLTAIVNFLGTEVTRDLILIWPIHPRTAKRLKSFSLWKYLEENTRIILLNPVAYLEMLRLNMGAKVVLTDSGGIQEESCVLGTPCLTMRWNTERPVTLREFGGSGVLTGNQLEKIREEYQNVMNSSRTPFRPEFWDGKAAPRCLNEIVDFLKPNNR